MDSHVLPLIRTRYNTFSASQKTVADFVLNHADEVMMSSLSDFAKNCGVSEPTIMRFLRKIEYDSYQVFRVNIAQELAHGKGENIYEEVGEKDSAEEVRDKVIQQTARSIEDSAQILKGDVIESFADMILKAENVLLVGIGASAAVAYDFYHKLVRLGISAAYSHDAHMINILASNLKRGDLLITITHSGESREILDAITLAKKEGCAVAAVTSFPHSSAAKLAQCVLLSSSIETRYRSDALTSRIIQMVIIDIIYINLALRLGDEAQKQLDKSRVAVAKNKT